MDDYGRYLKFIKHNYVPLYDSLYSIENWKFNESFIDFIKYKNNFKINSYGSDIYSFEFLDEDFCELLIQEMEHFKMFCEENELKITRPNSMNKEGCVLNEFGFYKILNKIVKVLLEPLVEILYNQVKIPFISQHSFIVSYEMNKDLKLKSHVDDSKVTLNLCLERKFKKGELKFYKNGGFLIDHKSGTAIIHLGSDRHSALEIASGERHNLIIWMK